VNLGVSRFVASTFGLCAFVVAIVAGLAVDNPASQTLIAALVALLVCNLLGWCIGVLAERIVADHLRTLTGPPQSRAAAAAQSTIDPVHPRSS
jgi:tetrahydromethanopterin S-methyltransferase subunit C